MPSVIGRAYDDLALDYLVTRLAAFRDREKAISSAVNFNIERDRKTSWSDLSAPLVVLEEDTDTPESAGSTARKAYSSTAKIRAICVVPQLGDPDAAYSRLYYLKEQVRVALWALPTIDFGQAVGQINIGRPTWTRVEFDDREMEASILCGTWTFDIVYPWTPETATGTAMTELSVAVGDWSALYEFGGTP